MVPWPWWTTAMSSSNYNCEQAVGHVTYPRYIWRAYYLRVINTASATWGSTCTVKLESSGSVASVCHIRRGMFGSIKREHNENQLTLRSSWHWERADNENQLTLRTSWHWEPADNENQLTLRNSAKEDIYNFTSN